jgi:hypothetical protein
MHFPTRRMIGRLLVLVAIGVALLLQGASAGARPVTSHHAYMKFPGVCHDMPMAPKAYHHG